MRVINVEQGSDAWLKARSGIPTASEFHSVLAKGKGITRDKYLLRIAGERVSGTPARNTFKTEHMDRGNEEEWLARAAYELRTGNLVDRVGLIVLDDNSAAASPDGLIGDDGGIEIKSVIRDTQTATIRGGSVPTEHKAQIQGNLWVSGRKYWDFCSYCSDIAEHLQTFIIRCYRDEKYIAELAKAIEAFNIEADELARVLNTTPTTNIDLQACSSTVTEQEGGGGCLRSAPTRL